MQQVWRPARLTAEQMFQRRRAAAAAFPRIRAGRGSQAQLARELGVGRSAVCQWYRLWCAAGVRALKPRVRGGPTPKLTAAQWRTLKRRIAQGALAAGFPNEQWTLRRVAMVIRREFGVTYHFRYLERPLRQHGITLQHPTVQARERDEALVRAFLIRDWEALKKRLVASDAALPSWTRRVTRFGPP